MKPGDANWHSKVGAPVKLKKLSDVEWDHEADVVVIGIGGAGIAAALQSLDVSFRTAFDNFLGQFGHFSDSGNDFSYEPWREDPDLVLTMVMDFSAADTQKEYTNWETLNLRPFDRFRLGPWYRRARDFR